MFYDFHAPLRCLTFEIEHQHYKRVVVQVDKNQDPVSLVKQITARLHKGTRRKDEAKPTPAWTCLTSTEFRPWILMGGLNNLSLSFPRRREPI